MQSKRALVLLGVLLALSAVAYWDEWQTKRDESAEKQKNLALNIVETEVDGIRFIDRELSLDVHLKKDGDGWQMTQPRETRADAATIANLLTTLREFKFEKVVSESRDKWQSFGLAEAVRTIEIQGGGKTQTIHVGSKAPIGYSVYFRINDLEESYIGSQYLLTATSKTVRDFRNKEIVKISAEQVSSFTYMRDRDLLVQGSWSSGKFSTAIPTSVEIQESEVRAVLDELSRAKALDFASVVGANAVQGWAGDHASITISWEEGAASKSSVRLKKIGDAPWLQVADGDDLYKVSEEAWAALRRTTDDFRSRALMKMDTEQLASVEVDGTVYMRRADGMFYDSKDVAVDRIKDLVFDIAYAKAEKFLDAADSVREVQKQAPQIIVRLAFKDGVAIEPMSLRMFADASDSSKYWVESSGRRGLMQVPKDVFANAVPRDQGNQGAAGGLTGDEGSKG